MASVWVEVFSQIATRDPRQPEGHLRYVDICQAAVVVPDRPMAFVRCYENHYIKPLSIPDLTKMRAI